MTTPISNYIWPGQTHFGFGAVTLVGQEASACRAKHVFVLADHGIITAGLLEPVTNSLKAAELSYTIYDRVVPNPDTVAVDAAVAAFRQSGADLIVAEGGGSALDMAKGVRLVAGGPPEASIGEYLLILGDEARPAPNARDLPPLLAVPTTAGSGSEATPWGVVTDNERKLKAGIGGAYLMPTVALVDPDLTMTMPPGLTAATGLDALSHLVEAYVSTNHNPILDPMILYGIELIGRSLRVAVAQGSNRNARRDVAEASLIGGIVITSKWLGACHSLAHQLSTFAGVHHGVAIALMLPHQMAYSLVGSLQRYAHIGKALDPSRTAVRSLRRQAEDAVEAVAELIRDVGLPTRLQDAGVAEALIPAMAKNAYVDLNWASNPRTVNEEIMEKLYRQAY